MVMIVNQNFRSTDNKSSEMQRGPQEFALLKE